MRECPFKDCGKRIPSSLFSCTRHWQLLRADQKARLYEAYHGWEFGTISGDELKAVQQQVLDEVEGRTHA